MLRSSRGVSGRDTSGDASGSGSENDGSTDAPIPASTIPNTLAEWPSSCTTCGATPWRAKIRSISGRLPDAKSSSTSRWPCKAVHETDSTPANG
ncbi:hypothetical protein D3C87_1709240 [compost metagenome]